MMKQVIDEGFAITLTEGLRIEYEAGGHTPGR
jgi:hypothetical protein